MTVASDRPVPRIIDATLREGMQSAAGRFSLDASVDVARALVRCGVDAIECGHPAIDDDEVLRVAAVVEAAGDVPVLAHARADERDIAAVHKTGAAWAGIFLGVNDVSRRVRLPGRSPAELMRTIEHSVGYARSLGLRVRFTVEDGSRTERDLLVAAFRVAVEAGADRVCVADTVGVLEPPEVAELVSAVRAALPGTPVELHLHDDRGLAMAGALAGLDAGAVWISTSVNGLGERAGVVDLAALCANLAYRGGRPLPDGAVLQDLSRRVAAYARSAPDDRRPVVGRNAFRHAARLHVLAVERDPSAYEWIQPKRVGACSTTGGTGLPTLPEGWIVDPKVISATELRYHRAGPGDRHVMIDERFVPGARQYCIARRIPHLDDYGQGHVDTHVHTCDSLFMFLGADEGYRGLSVEVTLGDRVFPLESPASVFIPAGVRHGYRVVGGAGTYLNHVLAGEYNASLLEPVEG